MSDNYIRISELIRVFEEKADEIANRLANGVSYEEYLRQVGRYKATVGFVDSLRSRLEKRKAADPDLDDEENDLDLEEGEAGPIEPKSVSRRTKPRAWGGV